MRDPSVRDPSVREPNPSSERPSSVDPRGSATNLGCVRRSTYAESFQRFVNITGGDGELRPSVERRPHHDEDPLGPTLFRMRLEDCAVERMTLPGLYVCRSDLRRVSFTGSDLHLSTLCWNDFRGCWFDACDLQDTDFRASWFIRCQFSNSDLSDCDLRRATFDDCDFTNTVLRNARASRSQRALLPLNDEQVAAMKWDDEPGPEPPGG